MGKPLGHYRLASKAAGDDVSRARYVRTPHEAAPGQERKRRLNKPRLPGFESAFIREARTKFPKAVRPASAFKRLLASGHNNIKIGRDVRKGHLRGYWIYTLSLQERATCPISCGHWQTCYGNNMPFAKRIDHTDPAFLPKLEAEITALCDQAARSRVRKGILIRLHALGDFYSIAYTQFWMRMLAEHRNLAIYGYTAHSPLAPMGAAVELLNFYYPERSFVRFSNGRLATMSTVSIGSVESCPPDAFVCPEQTGKTLGCDTCGACWGTRKNVAFLEH